jgi:hypothetical protein
LAQVTAFSGKHYPTRECPGLKLTATPLADNQTFCKMLLGPYGDIGIVKKLKKNGRRKMLSPLIETCPQKDLQEYEYFAA